MKKLIVYKRIDKHKAQDHAVRNVILGLRKPQPFFRLCICGKRCTLLELQGLFESFA
jgi:hypothetical protein